jgi:hypothetical protein
MCLSSRSGCRVKARVCEIFGKNPLRPSDENEMIDICMSIEKEQGRYVARFVLLADDAGATGEE